MATPQATVDQFYVNSALKGDAAYAYSTIRLDDPLSLYRDSNKNIHLTAATAKISAGKGITMAQSPNTPVQISVDSAFVAFLADPPTGPGKCDRGTGAWASDNSFFYFCVPNVTGDGFVWSRVAMQTTW